MHPGWNNSLSVSRFEEDGLCDARGPSSPWSVPACVHSLPVFHTGGRKGFDETDPFYCFIKDAHSGASFPRTWKPRRVPRFSGLSPTPAPGTSPTAAFTPSVQVCAQRGRRTGPQGDSRPPKSSGLPVTVSPCPPGRSLWQAAHSPATGGQLALGAVTDLDQTASCCWWQRDAH